MLLSLAFFVDEGINLYANVNLALKVASLVSNEEFLCTTIAAVACKFCR